MKYLLAGLAGFLVYEAVREVFARSIRRNTPAILRRELATRSPVAGVLAPALGTVVVSEAAGAIVEQTVLDTLPTAIGRRRAPGVDE